MLEWLEISPELTLIATATRAYLHVPPAFGTNPFEAPMRGEGTSDTTHWLLEGAMMAAARAFARQAVPDCEFPLLEPSQASSASNWAYRLAGYYHTTHATRRLLPAVARRFAAHGREQLARWAEQKTGEEAGHDELALRDLTDLGYRAHELVEALTPPRAKAWVAFFERLAAADDPIGCVGYAHALERLALLRGSAEVRAIELRLPKDVNATRCLRVHSGLGGDRRHVQENVATTSGLSADERRNVVKACYLTACIYFDPALDDDFHSAGIEAAISPFRMRPQPHTALVRQRLPTR